MSFYLIILFPKPFETIRQFRAPVSLVCELGDQQRERLDRAIQQAASGRSFSPAELCALQLRAYLYGENLEVFSQLLDRAVSAVKSTLNTQV